MTSRLAAVVVLCLFGMSSQVLLKKGLTRVGGFDVRQVLPSLGRMIVDPFVLAAGACLVAAFVLYLTILSKNQLSVFYPLAVGINFVFLGVSSALVLQEPWTGAKVLGLALILAGISCFAVSKSGI